jgi:hypothetical protein
MPSNRNSVKVRYAPAVMKEPWAKFGTLAVIYERVRPMLIKANNDEYTIASSTYGARNGKELAFASEPF